MWLNKQNNKKQLVFQMLFRVLFPSTVVAVIKIALHWLLVSQYVRQTTNGSKKKSSLASEQKVLAKENGSI